MEPIRPERHPRGNHWTNSGRLKRQLGHEIGAKSYQGHSKRLRVARVPAELRELLDATA